jgi:hypothetical protein
MVHSCQMLSLSMNMLATKSQLHHPFESFLHGGEWMEQPSQHPSCPDLCKWAVALGFSLVDNTPFSSLEPRRRTIGRVPMYNAYANGVCFRSYFCLLWVSHHWLTSVAVNLHKAHGILQDLQCSSLLHRLQGLPKPSISSATPWYLSSLCPFSDNSHHVLYSAIPYYQAMSSITIPEHITLSYHNTSTSSDKHCSALKSPTPCKHNTDPNTPHYSDYT